MAVSSSLDRHLRSSPETSVWRHVSTWLPPLIAVVAIAIESTNTFGSSNTSRWLRPAFERLLGHMTDASWGTFHHVLRKTGHVCGYGLVCLAFLRAWLRTFVDQLSAAPRPWRFYCCALAVLSTDMVASLDEWHQTFLASRTGNIVDVGIDTAGALLSCLLVAAIYWLLPRRIRV